MTIEIKKATTTMIKKIGKTKKEMMITMEITTMIVSTKGKQTITMMDTMIKTMTGATMTR